MDLNFLNTTVNWLQRVGLIRKEDQKNVNDGVDLEVLKEREEKHIWF